MASYQGVATQLYVWDQILGAQGSSVADSLGIVLAEVASARFDGFEGNLSLIDSESGRDKLAGLLEQYSLQLSGLYSGGTFHDAAQAPQTIDSIAAAAEHAVRLGCAFINVNPASIGRDKTGDELIVQGEYLDQLGRTLRGLGAFLTCHNHTPEIRNGAREFRSICAYTTPMFVGMCVDTHWVFRGGEDPIALMQEYSDRVRALHLRNSVGSIWAEAFGEGDLDHLAMHDFLQGIGYGGWLTVELAYEQETEVTRPLAENAQLSCDYAREVFQLPSHSETTT